MVSCGWICYVKFFGHVNTIRVGNGVEHFHITVFRVAKGKRFRAHSQNCQKRLPASWCLYVCPSAWNNSAPIGRIFMIFYVWVFFRKSDEKIQMSLKSVQITGSSNEGTFTLVIIFCWFLLRMRNVSDKTCREKSEHILFSNNMEKYNSTGHFTNDSIIWRMRFAGWIIKLQTYTQNM